MTGIIILVALINLFIVIISAVKIPKSNYIKKYFIAFALSTTLWMVANVLLEVFQLHMFMKLSYGMGAIMMTFAMMFVIAFTAQKKTQNRTVILLLIGITMLILCLIDGVFFIPTSEIMSPKMTSLFSIYSAMLLGYLIVMIISTALSMRRLKGGEKIQAKFIIIGIITFGISSLTTSFILPLVGISEYIMLDCTTSMFFVGFSFYAIISSYFTERDRLKSEMSVAMEIQTAILPPAIEHEELEISAMMRPADEVGGDYYDFLKHDEDLWLAIGDVTGHGLKSGLIAIMAEASFIQSVQSGVEEPKEVISLMSRVLMENIRNRMKDNYFMTMNILKYEGDGNFKHAGSHCDFLIYRAKTDTFEQHTTEGIYLGMIKDCEKATYQKEFHMDVDDIMILVTDGITEARTELKQMYEYEQIKEIVRKKKDSGIPRITHGIIKSALDWCNDDQEDDMTVMVIRRK